MNETPKKEEYKTIKTQDGSKTFEYMSLKDFYDAAYKDQKIVTIASQSQVKKAYNQAIQMNTEPSRNKKPFGRWDEHPLGYSGVDDEKYGSAVICDYYSSLGLHFVCIDFDNHGKARDIPLSVLKTYAMKIISHTHCKTTPSGGLHIYLLSRQAPIAKQPFSNIDYQANTGKGRGKYIITNYRYNKKGTTKEHYTKLAESTNDILIVENSDQILRALLKDLEENGYIPKKEEQKSKYKSSKRRIKQLKDEDVEKHLQDIVDVLKPYATTAAVSSRQYYSCGIAGYLKKQGYTQKNTYTVIKGVFADDEERQDRIRNVELTYNKNNDDIKGWRILKEYLPQHAQQDLTRLTYNYNADLKTQITRKLGEKQGAWCKTRIRLYKQCTRPVP